MHKTTSRRSRRGKTTRLCECQLRKTKGISTATHACLNVFAAPAPDKDIAFEEIEPYFFRKIKVFTARNCVQSRKTQEEMSKTRPHTNMAREGIRNTGNTREGAMIRTTPCPRGGCRVHSRGHGIPVLRNIKALKHYLFLLWIPNFLFVRGGGGHSCS